MKGKQSEHNMSHISDLQNFTPGGQLTCQDLPFLPVCEEQARYAQGGRYRHRPSDCAVGTVTGTYSNGDPFMANVIETSRHGFPDRVYRNIALPGGMMFQLRNTSRHDETYDQLNGGETLALDVIESGLTGVFNLNKQDATLCRSRSYGAGLLPYQGGGVYRGGATLYGDRYGRSEVGTRGVFGSIGAEVTDPSYAAGYQAGFNAGFDKAGPTCDMPFYD